MKIALIGIGGILGGLCRYYIGTFWQDTFIFFPLHTFVANLLGCFGMGLVQGGIDKNIRILARLKDFFLFGFFGGLTTCSTFVSEFHGLFLKAPAEAFFYVLASVALGTYLFLAGKKLVKQKTSR